MGDITPIIFVAAVVILTAAGVVAGYFQYQQTTLDWEQFASRVGLTMTRGQMFNPHQIHGEYRRRQANLTTYRVRLNRRSSAVYTRFSVEVANPSGSGFSLETTGMLDKWGEALGMKDEKIGNEDFDNRFNIHCTPPEYASLLLGSDPMIQGSISQIYDKGFKLVLEGSFLTFTRHGVERDVLALERILNTLCDLADKIDRKGNLLLDSDILK